MRVLNGILEEFARFGAYHFCAVGFDGDFDTPNGAVDVDAGFFPSFADVGFVFYFDHFFCFVVHVGAYGRGARAEHDVTIVADDGACALDGEVAEFV